MNDCPRGDVRDLLPDLLHDRLDGIARDEVERHVAECPLCAEELELLRTMRSVLRAPDAVDVTRVAAAVRREAVDGRAASRRRVRRLDWRVAAAAAILVTGGLTLAVVQRGAVPVAVLPGGSAPQVASVSATTPGLTFGGGFADLSESDLERLLQDVDSLSGLPAAEPTPVLRGVEEEIR